VDRFDQILISTSHLNMNNFVICFPASNAFIAYVQLVLSSRNIVLGYPTLYPKEYVIETYHNRKAVLYMNDFLVANNYFKMKYI